MWRSFLLQSRISIKYESPLTIQSKCQFETFQICFSDIKRNEMPRLRIDRLTFFPDVHHDFFLSVTLAGKNTEGGLEMHHCSHKTASRGIKLWWVTAGSWFMGELNCIQEWSVYGHDRLKLFWIFLDRLIFSSNGLIPNSTFALQILKCSEASFVYMHRTENN